MRGNEAPYVPALGYRWLTPLYDGVVAMTTREATIKASLIEQARIESGHQVLDLASGTGTLAVRIKQQEPGAEVTGVDGDTAMISRAVRKAQRAGVFVRFDRALSWSLPYPSATFDRVVSSLFFHHLSWDAKVRTAHEVYRVLKPGAELHVADWGRSANAVMRGLFLFVQLLDGVETTRDNVAGRLVALLQGAGFIDVSQERAYSTMFGTLALYRAVKPRSLLTRLGI